MAKRGASVERAVVGSEGVEAVQMSWRIDFAVVVVVDRIADGMMTEARG